MSEDLRPNERPRLQLKPRDPNAAQTYEAQRARAGSNPFGAAKPREQVIAERLGKTEEEVLKDAAKKERPKLRLSAEQLEERKQAEAVIEEVRSRFESADAADRPGLEGELAEREAELEVLLDGFEAMALEAALRGEVQRPSERRQQQQQSPHGEAHVEGAHASGRGGYGGAADSGGGGSYDRPRTSYDREGSSGRGREPREYNHPYGGYDREGGVRGGRSHRGGRGYDRMDRDAGAYERAPREGYERHDRSTYDREGGLGSGVRDQPSGRNYERNDSGGYGNARSGRGGGSDWGSGGDRGAGGNDGDRGSYKRGGGAYDRGGRSGGSYDALPRGPSGGLDGANAGGGRGGARGGYGPRGGYDPTFEELTTTDYVSPYTVGQDRF